MKLILKKLLKKPTPPSKPHVRLQQRYEQQLKKYMQQRDELLTLMMYFHRVWRQTKHSNRVEVDIQLKRLNQMVSPGNRYLVQAVGLIWFNRLTRGNSLSQRCSTWAPRDTPYVNTILLTTLAELEAQNTEVVQSVYSICREGNTITLEQKTTLRFKDEAQAVLYESLIQELINQESP